MIPPERKIAILVVDNHPTTMAGLRTLFSKTKDIHLVGELSSGYDVYLSIPKLKPTLLLLDIATSGPNPIELIQWIHENHPSTCVLIFTFIEDVEKISQMIDAGACGYISKEENEDTIVDSIRRVANGEIIFSQEQVAKVKKWQKEVGEKIKLLTAREIEILKLLAQGYDNNAIAEHLTVSPKTAAFHSTNIFSKLGVKSRQEAAIWAVKNLSDNLE